MSKLKAWITILLTLIALALIGWSLTDSDDRLQQVDSDHLEPTYQSEHTITVVYSPTGLLSYKLVAQDVKYFGEGQTTWFTRPVMTLFDENSTATWSVRADRAKLTRDKMLYLYGNVEVNSLTRDSQIERITTNNAQVNLVTQDVSSNDEVTLYGANFTSNGMKMRGNLRNKTAELIEKVKTYYEIQNQQRP